MAHSQMKLGCKVYMGGLDDRVSKHEVEEFFQGQGSISNIWIAAKPPGFAFVEFATPESAEAAVTACDGKEIHGRRIRVEVSKSTGAKPRGSGPPGGWAGRNMNGGGGDYAPREQYGRDYGRDSSRDYRSDYRSSSDHYRREDRDHRRRSPSPRRGRSRSRSPRRSRDYDRRSRSPDRRRAEPAAASSSRDAGRRSSRSRERERETRDREPRERERERSPPRKARSRSRSPRDRSPPAKRASSRSPDRR